MVEVPGLTFEQVPVFPGVLGVASPVLELVLEDAPLGTDGLQVLFGDGAVTLIILDEPAGNPFFKQVFLGLAVVQNVGAHTQPVVASTWHGDAGLGSREAATLTGNAHEEHRLVQVVAVADLEHDLSLAIVMHPPVGPTERFSDGSQEEAVAALVGICLRGGALPGFGTSAIVPTNAGERLFEELFTRWEPLDRFLEVLVDFELLDHAGRQLDPVFGDEGVQVVHPDELPALAALRIGHEDELAPGLVVFLPELAALGEGFDQEVVALHAAAVDQSCLDAITFHDGFFGLGGGIPLPKAHELHLAGGHVGDPFHLFIGDFADLCCILAVLIIQHTSRHFFSSCCVGVHPLHDLPSDTATGDQKDEYAQYAIERDGQWLKLRLFVHDGLLNS